MKGASRDARRDKAWAAALLAATLGCSARRNSSESATRPRHDATLQGAMTLGATPSDAVPSDAANAPLPFGSTDGPSPPPRTMAVANGSEPLLVVDDPTVLASLEARGADLYSLLGGEPSPDTYLGAPAPPSNARLAHLARYAALLQVLEADLAEIRRGDPHAGVSVARSSHRLFDARWLRSPAARFELVGVVNRLDRAGIVGGCGEVRLLYRLAYAVDVNQRRISSRLPMTISLELNALSHPSSAEHRASTGLSGSSTDGACGAAAQRWVPPRDARHGAALSQWLLSERGPLLPEQLRGTAIRRVAVNMQSVRWPSTVRPDLGGHAEYVLRAFAHDGVGKLAPAPLENTLDVARVSRGSPLFAKLVEWVIAAEHRPALDGATITLPDELCAKRAVSVTPRGFARLKNRPFSAVLREADVARAALSGARHVSSPAALLRRLDDLSCPGCHESRSVAGFHFLGIDRDPVRSNALAAAGSPHFTRDQARRGELVTALLAGRVPSYDRPLAERAARGDGGYGAHCGLGDPGFAAWTCDPGYRCDRYDAPEGDVTVGTCLPVEGSDVGDPCEVGSLVPNADPLRDRVTKVHKPSCSAGAVCNTNAVGFPGGMCTASCDALPEHGACGAIAVLDAFNACLAAKHPFETCITEHASPAGLRRCSANEPCRDDYICTGSGVCIPPYFVFQMRVDGHPVPPHE